MMDDESVNNDVEKLHGAFKQVQADVAVLSKAIAELTALRAKESLADVRQAGEKVQEKLSQVAAEARAAGQSGISALEQEITGKPLTAVMLAFLVGLVVGKAGSRG